jgi:hypothetical protein
MKHLKLFDQFNKLNENAHEKAKEYFNLSDDEKTVMWRTLSNAEKRAIQYLTPKKETPLPKSKVYTLDNPNQFFHGSNTMFPFKNFDSSMDASGVVSNNKKYGGFFFTDKKSNADYFTDLGWVAKVNIDNLEKYDTTHPPTALKKAQETKKNYLIEDVVDGQQQSNVAVVPHSNLDDVTILEWIYDGDKEILYESWDDFFAFDDDEMYDDDGNLMTITQDIIEDTLVMISDFDYLYNNIPLFKEYYDSKV